jgi:splicing factor, arginine/serine-rich 2
MANRERKPPPNVDGMYTLKVDNVPSNVSPDALKDFFTPYGEIGDIHIPRRFGTHEAKGYAFVRFLDKDNGLQAMEALNGKEFEGRSISIQEAKVSKSQK